MNALLEFLRSPFIFDAFDKTLSACSSMYGIAGYLIYIIGCYMLYGFTKSISITYYYHQAAKYNFFKVHNLRWLFQLFMISSALSIFFIAQNGLYFIVCALFTLMAFFPSVLYKGKIGPHLIYHSIFASSAIALMVVGLPLCYGMSYLPLCLAVAVADILIFIFVKQKPSDDKYDDDYEHSTTRLYWIENVSIVSFIIGLVIANIF